jgi:hypothetical protein
MHVLEEKAPRCYALCVMSRPALPIECDERICAHSFRASTIVTCGDSDARPWRRAASERRPGASLRKFYMFPPIKRESVTFVISGFPIPLIETPYCDHRSA